MTLLMCLSLKRCGQSAQRLYCSLCVREEWCDQFVMTASRTWPRPRGGAELYGKRSGGLHCRTATL
jgi:hypothetical protein